MITNTPKPTVMFEGKRIPFTYYQLANAKFCLGIFKSGMKMRGVTLKLIRQTLNLKSKNTSDCLAEVQKMMDEYRENVAPILQTNSN